MGKPPTTLEKLAAYNCWANEMQVQCLDEQADAIPSSCLHLLSHICNAQLIWISRIENTNNVPGVFDEHTFAECREILATTSEHLRELATMPSIGLTEVIVYTNTKGENFETMVQDILIHVFNHGSYHRAQIARDLRLNGLTPVNTDYITFVRSLVIAQK